MTNLDLYIWFVFLLILEIIGQRRCYVDWHWLFCCFLDAIFTMFKRFHGAFRYNSYTSFDSIEGSAYICGLNNEKSTSHLKHSKWIRWKLTVCMLLNAYQIKDSIYNKIVVPFWAFFFFFFTFLFIVWITLNEFRWTFSQFAQCSNTISTIRIISSDVYHFSYSPTLTI